MLFKVSEGGKSVLSKKSNINMDHYKTKGRGRQGEAVVHDDYKHSLAQATASNDGRNNPFRQPDVGSPIRLANPRGLQRMKKLRKRRGLSAKQLMERKLSQRAIMHPNRNRVTTFSRLSLESRENVASS